MLHMYFVLLVFAAALVVAGCGGSSKTDSTIASTASATTPVATTPTTTTTRVITVRSGTPLSHSKWVAKANAICHRTNLKLESSTIKSRAEATQLFAQAADYDHTEAIEMSKVVPPAAVAHDWSEIVAGIQKFGEYTAIAAEYARANNLGSAGSIVSKGKAIQEKETAIAKQDGIKECSYP